MINAGIPQKTLNGALKARIQANLPKAQYMVDTQVVNDMIPYMPMVTGTFINTVRMRNASLAGSGEVCAATGVMGRFLYYGKKMVDSQTGKGPRPIRLAGGEIIFRYRLGAKLIPTELPLSYNTAANPMAGPLWFDRAKEQCYDNWCKTAKGALINGG